MTPGSVRRSIRFLVLVALVSTLAACDRAAGAPAPSQRAAPASALASPAAPSPSPSADPSPSSTSSTPPRITRPVTAGATVEGLIDVGGHDIYARCAGTGSPTVVYFTGWAEDRGKRAVAIARRIERPLGSDVRMCSYERRNTGRSDQVKGTQDPEDVVADVDGVLDAMGEEGPFVLLGASFGGLVASAYAVAHPERVSGIVLLDASTGADYEIEEMEGLKGMCRQSNRDADAWSTLEMIDNCSLASWIHERREQEPDVPLLFLASTDASDRGTEAQDAVRKAWVDGFDPGTWRVVSAPHWMDDANPALVAAAVCEVIDQSR